MIKIVEHFFGCFSPILYPLGENPFFSSGTCFEKGYFILWSLISWIFPFVCNMVGKELLPISWFAFSHIDKVLCFTVSFYCMRCHLSILDLKEKIIGVLFRKIPPVTMSSRLFPSFFSISLNMSGFMWRSMIHMDLSSVQEDNGSIHILLHTDLHLNQHRLLKRLSFIHCMDFALCQI